METENLKKLAMVDIAEQLLRQTNQPVNIYELLDNVAGIKGVELSNTEMLVALYMDITLSGKFVFMGDDMWALKDGRLSEWDKDSYAFVTHDDSAIEEAIEIEEFITDIDDEVIVEAEDDSDDSNYDEEEETQFDDILPEDGFDDDVILDDGVIYDEEEEEDYNKIMDQFEDMYED